jgi:hypothetical protein
MKKVSPLPSWEGIEPMKPKPDQSIAKRFNTEILWRRFNTVSLQARAISASPLVGLIVVAGQSNQIAPVLLLSVLPMFAIPIHWGWTITDKRDRLLPVPVVVQVLVAKSAVQMYRGKCGLVPIGRHDQVESHDNHGKQQTSWQALHLLMVTSRAPNGRQA